VPLANLQRMTSVSVMVLDLGGGVTMDLVLIRPGRFMMGSEQGEGGRAADEDPLHAVTLTAPFFMGVTPVTQAQYTAVVGGNPSFFKGPTRPIESITWAEADAFAKKLAEKVGQPVRLPTEAEWEYGCRAGAITWFPFGNDWSILGAYAWYVENSDKETHPVGQKKPNAWGLYDMLGNVMQYCSDVYGPYTQGAVVDPVGPLGGKTHVLRGGAWNSLPPHNRPATRTEALPDLRPGTAGLRVVVPITYETLGK
jgi:eukaryotic-like serine/threonine-protein kinase